MNHALPKLAAAAVATLLAATSAQASPEIRALRANYDVVLDNLQASLERNGNTRDASLLKRSRETLMKVSDDSFELLFAGEVPDLGNRVRELRKLTPSLAKSVGLPTPGPIHSACSDGLDADSMYATLIAKQTTQALLDSTNYVCTQDVLGINGSLACIPLAVANSIATSIWEVRSWCNGELAGAKADAAYNRLAHIHDDIADARSVLLSTSSSQLTTILGSLSTSTSSIIANSNDNRATIVSVVNANAAAINNNITNSTNAINANVNASTSSIIANANANTTSINNNVGASTTTIVNNTNATKDAIVGELRAVACEIIRLLNTPDGQRGSTVAACSAQPGFPYSWNRK